MKKNPYASGGLAVLVGAAMPVLAYAQDFGSSVFSDGGGLLLEPSADPIVQQPGVLNAPAGAGGAADGEAQAADQTAQLNQGIGPLLTFNISTGFTYEDDEDEPTERFFGTRFNAGIFTDTRNQSFSFNVGAETRIDADDGSELLNPLSRLTYQIANRSTQFNADLSYRESDVDDTFLDPDFDGDDLIVDGGTRETQRARLRLILGRDTRVGLDTRLTYTDVDFSDTIDPDLNPETRIIAETDLRFSIDRRLELTLFSLFDQRDEEDAVQTEETDAELGLRANVLLDRAWTGQFEIAAVREDTETTATSVEEDGFRTSAEITRFMPNGRLAFAASYEDVDDDTVSSFEVSRAMQLANGAAISATIGVVSFDGDGVEPLFGFSYAQEILRGQTISLSLSQTPGEDDDDNDLIRTLFNVSYDRALTRNSRLNLNLALAEADEQVGDDTRAVSFGVSYAYDLTEEWSLVANATTRRTFEDGADDERTDEVSIRLERSFSIRP
ncbi:MAG: hypothetical protein AAGF68_00445 [Pseudomonadota bacterium]